MPEHPDWKFRDFRLDSKNSGLKKTVPGWLLLKK
jgi:hypothetical protein